MIRRKSSLSVLAVLASAGFALAGCGSSSSGSTPPSSGGTTPASAAAFCGGQTGSGKVVVGYANFPENEALASIYAAALDKCGYSASTKGFDSREVYYPALKKGQIQVVPEYAATLTDFINTAVNGPNAKSKASSHINVTMQHLKAELPSNLAVLTPSVATDKNSFAVTKKFATANHISTMSQLATYSKSHPLVLGGAPECPTRPFCEIGLKNTYGIHIKSFKSLSESTALTIKSIKTGSIDFGLVYTSDPTVESNGLVVLTDDKHLQASDNIVPIVASNLASGAAANALNAVDKALTQNVLIQINKGVELQHASYSTVANAFVAQLG
jgi:osmoprotectant transport system substrate-binding protein